MFILIFRTILIYLLTILAMRLMGKKQLGELQPSELVSAIMISNLASVSIETPELPLLPSIMPVFIIVVCEIFLSAFCIRSRRVARLISGGPRVVIRDGVIDQNALYDLRFTVDDLIEALHEKDVFELSDVSFAMVETNGSLSVQRKFSSDTPCNKDLGIPSPQAGQPSLQLIVDGCFNYDNMRLCGVDEKWVISQCHKQNLERSDILLFLCNDAMEFSIIKKESRH